MKPYMIIYRKKGISDTLSLIIKANNQDEAVHVLKLKFGAYDTDELSVKDVRLMDRVLIASLPLAAFLAFIRLIMGR